MASSNDELVRRVGEEREHLVEAVATLRTELKAATDIGGKLRANLPAATGGALGLGFVVAGGIGATVRLLLRR